MKQIGIYKITSPNGRIYIGQSIDIQRRFYRYKRLNDDGVSTELIGEMFSLNGSTVRKHLRKLKQKGFPLPEAVKPKK